MFFFKEELDEEESAKEEFVEEDAAEGLLEDDITEEYKVTETMIDEAA